MELTPEQVNQFIATSILNSQIGKVVQEAVNRSITELSKSYDNPFDKIIRQQIAKLIEAEIATTYTPMLKERIEKAVAAWMTEEMMAKIIKAVLEKLDSRY